MLENAKSQLEQQTVAREVEGSRAVKVCMCMCVFLVASVLIHLCLCTFEGVHVHCFFFVCVYISRGFFPLIAPISHAHYFFLGEGRTSSSIGSRNETT